MGSLCSGEEEQERTEDICSCRPAVWKLLKVEWKMAGLGEGIGETWGGSFPPHLQFWFKFKPLCCDAIVFNLFQTLTWHIQKYSETDDSVIFDCRCIQCQGWIVNPILLKKIKK